MSDKEILLQTCNQFVKNLISNLFGINTIGTDALITYAVNNMYDKYGIFIDPFIDKSDNINITLLSNAFKDVLKAKYKNGLVLNLFGHHIKFGENDISEIEQIFKKFKSNQ